MSLPVADGRRRWCAPKLPPISGSSPPPWDGPIGDLRFYLGDDFVYNNGVLLVLFETPSGFAILSCNGFHLYKPDAIQTLWGDLVRYVRATDIVWPKEFQTFDDKASAINVGTGVNTQLREMIMKWRLPGQKLVVGKQEYKSIIESRLEIPCLHNVVVMDLMWGIQRLMHKLVPGEKSELADEDRVPVSQGLQMLLSRYGFQFSPEMVNEEIVVAAWAVFHYDALVKEKYPELRANGFHLKHVSGINCDNWSPLKLATAFKIICTHNIDGSAEMFSKDVQLKLLKDANGYNGLINKGTCMTTYRRLVAAHRGWLLNKALLSSFFKKDKEVHVEGVHEADENKGKKVRVGVMKRKIKRKDKKVRVGAPEAGTTGEACSTDVAGASEA